MFKQLGKIGHPDDLVRGFANHGYFDWMPDEMYLKTMYRNHMGFRLNLKNPRRFSEKLQWLKLHDRNPLYTQIVDKYAVRDFIRDRIGDEYLIPLVMVCESVDDINWDALPAAFALKCTHGSGFNIICGDKSKLDIKDAKRKLKKWMRINWFYQGREWPYKKVTPKIICEKFMSETKNPPDDYKVMCFGGVPRYIQLHKGRFVAHQMEIFDVNWNRIPLGSKFIQVDQPTPKIEILDQLLDVAKKLSQGFRFVRVDLFVVDSKIYFNELTLYDGSGFLRFNPDEYDFSFGDLIDVS
ncbi:MAG: glycosyl transferase [Clostridiaceae bacterium]|nr:glycosyl transferase [Clostridiaceae bacterium]